ncbi:sensor histidine kinase [Intrasporangium sp. YIM S08009]|uniref:sensor histidine kinase n=1 Tax=Intrasporangium zincisolvens TaxID=3080018 RepID=UPI002B061A45|nr:sensor histidine kinase [Intrasporangium sp. YIM S08009]
MTPFRASRRRVPATRSDLPSGRVAESNPWERWGWIVQSVWLVFLVFPVVAILTGHLPAWQVVVGLVVTAAFGAVYARGAAHLNALERECTPSYRWGVLYVGALVACMAVMGLIIGFEAISYLPFVVSFGMFALPRPVSLALAVLAVVSSAVLAAVTDGDEGAWVVVAIVFAVAVMTGGVRLMSDRGRAYDTMSRELALVAERERVARDVHDVLGHSLTVVTVKAELAERLVDLDPERAKRELAEIQVLSRQALAEIRETVGGLRQARLDNELASARTALAGAGIQALVPEDPAAVDPRHRTVLAWVLREAMTNVVRHSDADACWVELDSNRLTVRDDGRGLEDRPEGNGIRGIRERVEAAGGRLSLATGPEGHGTVLEVTL